MVSNTGGGYSRKGRFIDEDGRTRMIVDVLEKTNHSKYMSHIFPSYTLGQWNIFNFFLYNFIDNSRKYDWKEWDFSKTMKNQFFHS